MEWMEAPSVMQFPLGSLNLLTNTWEFKPEPLLPLMTDNTDFTVIGVLGLPGAGKSTIMNELYQFDGTTIVPPFPARFPVQTMVQTNAQARHCTRGIELRVSSDRFILLDTQPLWSSSALMDLINPLEQFLPGETITEELALELMAIQMGVFLSSVCHVLILVTDGLKEKRLWTLFERIQMLNYGIPDPSFVQVLTYKLQLQELTPYFCADPLFVHTKLRESVERLKLALGKYLSESTVNYFVLPRVFGMVTTMYLESYHHNLLHQLRDHIISMPPRLFARRLSERDWLRNSAKVWDLVRRSPVIASYGNMLRTCGLF